MKAFWLVMALTICAQTSSAAPAEPASARLPVKRVVLYKNGVGYFEHSARVHGDQDLTIDFTSAQLNDALKSLTLIDEGNGRIAAVRYNSSAPVTQQLQRLHIPIAEDATLSDLLQSLRGARLEVRDHAIVATGRLLSLEEKQIAQEAPKPPLRQTWLTILDDAGQMRSFIVTPALALRPLDGEMRDDLSDYLRILAAARAQDLRRMTIAASGTGDRDIFVSYISEVPVWKTSYRIILQSGGDRKALLQGWAIVDNTVGEDWNGVELSLVSGAPQSFVQNLSQPYYTRRPEIPLPASAMLTPQTHEGTMETRSATEEASAAPSAAPRPIEATAENADATAGALGGVIGGIVGSTPATAPRNTAPYDRLQGFAASQPPPAIPADLGGLFEYKVNQRVTIAKNQSALVPILNANVAAEPVTLWSPDEPRPLRALWLRNDSGLTLDGGSFSIIAGNAFAGEGIFNVIHPKERRLLSYAVDDAVRVSEETDAERRPVRHIKIANGILVETREQRDHTTYKIRNSDTERRDVIIEHPRQNGWKLVSATQPDESAETLDRFRVPVSPNTTATLELEFVHALSTNIELASLRDDELALLVREGGADSAAIPILRAIVDQQAVVADLDRAWNLRKERIAALALDQQRLRENMKALKGSAEERPLVQRYTGELNAQEDQLATIRKEMADVATRHEIARQKLADLIANSAFDGER